MDLLSNYAHKIAFCVNSMLVLCTGVLHLLWDTVKKRHMGILNHCNQDKIMILGNGPSLNEIDFEQAKEDECIFCCVNFFPVKHKDIFLSIMPKYICLLDPEFFERKTEAYIDDINELFQVMNSVCWNITVITPKGRKLPIDNPYISYAWLSAYIPSYNSSKKIRNFLYRHNIAIVGAQNVVIGALNYFITSRFKTIYFAGVDMSEFKYIYVDDVNRKYVDTTHSYGSERHYYDEYKTTNWIDLAHILSAYCKMFLEFRHIAFYAHDMGVEVYNLSVNSYVDSFKKIKLYQKQ